MSDAARSRMRALFAALALVAAGGAFGVGWATSGLIERSAERRARAAIAAAGLEWLRVEADGAVLALTGAAPDPAGVDAARALAESFSRFASVRDAIAPPPPRSPVADIPAEAPPPTRVAILIGPGAPSFAGALPDAASRDRLAAALTETLGAAPEDFCLLSAAPPSDDWPSVERIAVAAAAALAHGKIVADAGGVSVSGAARAAEGADALAALSAQAAAAGVSLILRLDEPAAPTAPPDPQTEAAPDASSPDAAASFAPPDATAWLRAQIAPDLAVLTGAAPDEATRAAVLSYAGAALGAHRLHAGLAVSDAPAPEGWRAAALAAIDALAALEHGSALVASSRIELQGAVRDAVAAGAAARGLAAAAPDGWAPTSRVTVDLPAAAAATRLPPGRCAARLTEIAAADPILFPPGEAAIDPASDATLDALAATLRRCGGGAIRVEGHTDSQGSEAYNAQLSQSRADAVRAALIKRGVPERALTALGVGEAQPIADNATEDGRARNRRIAFVAADPAADVAPPDPEAP